MLDLCNHGIMLNKPQADTFPYHAKASFVLSWVAGLSFCSEMNPSKPNYGLVQDVSSDVDQISYQINLKNQLFY